MIKKRQKVLGYEIDLFSFNEAIEYTFENINNEVSTHIVTINPEIIELANKNERYSEIIENADLIIPDGIGIKLALKFKGIKQEQIPGIDFSKKLIELCAKNNKKIALIGAKEDVINKTVFNLKNEFQTLDIAYEQNGYFTEDEENKIIEKLKNSNAKLVLVALGAPKQEIFIQKCKFAINNATFIGVGGSFDVWAGEVKRAPKFYRKIGCEWLYRTIKQPERFKRIYKTLPLFLFKVIIEGVKNKNS